MKTESRHNANFVVIVGTRGATVDPIHWRIHASLGLNELNTRTQACGSSEGFMMTSSNGNIFRVTGLCAGNSPGEFPAQRPVTRSFDVFFDLRLNKRLSEQPWGWWFEMPSWSLWRQCNVQGCLKTWAPTQYKDRLSHVWDTYVRDKTVVRLSCLSHGDPYIGKTTSLYWDGPWL